MCPWKILWHTEPSTESNPADRPELTCKFALLMLSSAEAGTNRGRMTGKIGIVFPFQYQMLSSIDFNITSIEPAYEICRHSVFCFNSWLCNSSLLIELGEVFGACRGPLGSILCVDCKCVCSNCWLSSVWATKWTVIFQCSWKNSNTEMMSDRIKIESLKIYLLLKLN